MSAGRPVKYGDLCPRNTQVITKSSNGSVKQCGSKPEDGPDEVEGMSLSALGRPGVDVEVATRAQDLTSKITPRVRCHVENVCVKVEMGS